MNGQSSSGDTDLRVIRRQEAADGSVKLAFASPGSVAPTTPAGDGAGERPPLLEAVLLVNDKGRATACLSSQLGCAMGCRFCATGRLGLHRNCTTGEIIAQFDAIRREARTRDIEVTNAVFMGMGEALHNLDAVLPAIDILTDQNGRNIYPRRITVSTTGSVPGMRRLAEYRPALGLAYSLISARQELRNALIPAGGSDSLARARAALGEYQRATGKRLILEMVIFDQINHDEAEAEAVAAFARGFDCIVNVIPWNPIPSPPLISGVELAVPREEDVHRFAMMLSRRGQASSVRFTRGREVLGACGQLGDNSRG